MDQQKTIKGVIFDFDGTLFDLEIDWQKLNFTIKSELNVDSLHVNKSSNKAAFKLIGQAELEGVQKGRPKQDALKTLNQLKGTYKLAVTSRNNRSTVTAGLNKIGFEQKLPIVARENVKIPKPHPEALELTLNKLKLKPSDVLVVGDTNHDIEAAKNLGARCVAVKNLKLKFAPEGADFYIDSLADLEKVINTIQGSRDAKKDRP